MIMPKRVRWFLKHRPEALDGLARVSEHIDFVIMVADDLGYGDLGSYGHPEIRTPNIDRLANEGLRFTHGYAAAPVCSPARTGLLTGRIPSRVGIYDWIPPGSDVHLPAHETTVAELLKSTGYQTVYLGKWHLNGGLGLDNVKISVKISSSRVASIRMVQRRHLWRSKNLGVINGLFLKSSRLPYPAVPWRRVAPGC